MAVDVKLPLPLVVGSYDERRALDLVKMWRASFEHGVGVIDPHPLEDQVAYLKGEVVPNNQIVVVHDGLHGPIVAFVAYASEKVAQLYVHVDYHGRGIGTALLDLAKRESKGQLRLFTFARNTIARRFYERNGFLQVGSGFEETWQLEDVEFAWSRGDVEE